jgi:hypothetical protein
MDQQQVKYIDADSCGDLQGSSRSSQVVVVVRKVPNTG